MPIQKSSVLILFGVIGGTIGLASAYSYYKLFKKSKKYLRERRRWYNVKNQYGGSYVSPNQVKDIFNKLTPKQQREGIELPVFGIPISLRNAYNMDSDPEWLQKVY